MICGACRFVHAVQFVAVQKPPSVGFAGRARESNRIPVVSEERSNRKRAGQHRQQGYRGKGRTNACIQRNERVRERMHFHAWGLLERMLLAAYVAAHSECDTDPRVEHCRMPERSQSARSCSHRNNGTVSLLFTYLFYMW